MSTLMLQTEIVTGPYLLVFFIGTGLYLYSTYCGKKLLFDHDKKTGIIYSIINYFLQVIHWSFLGWGLMYVSGLSLAIGIKESAFSFTFSIASNFQISINSDSEFLLKFNLFAILALMVLFDLLLEIKNSVTAVLADHTQVDKNDSSSKDEIQLSN